MIIPAFVALLLSIPVLILGEKLVKKIPFLGKFNIPTPIAGGLVIAFVFLLLNVTGILNISFNTKVDTSWWTWLVTIESDWVKRPNKEIGLPFMVVFFTCVGLNASWDLVKRGSITLLVFLGLSIVLAVMQNALGVFLAKTMCQSPILGLVCGSASLIGGHGTVLGFADLFTRFGIIGADTVGVAAATFGLVAGSLAGGPVAVKLINKYNLTPPYLHTHKKNLENEQNDIENDDEEEPIEKSGSAIIRNIKNLFGKGWSFIGHLLLLIALLKTGAWASFYIQKIGITFPVYIGSMILGVLIRNMLDLLGKHWVNSETIDLIGVVALSIFLTIAIMTTNLSQLLSSALPMLIILTAQVIVAIAFCYYLVPAVLGKTYEVAVMAAGMLGFGLGSTSNAIANMRALVEHYGPAPQAFLVVPIVGAFLIDFVNALNITLFTNIFS